MDAFIPDTVGEGALVAGTAGFGLFARTVAKAAREAACATNVLDDMMYVSRWGREGLESGDWVMKGGKSAPNYLKSGKIQPGFGNEYASYSSGNEFLVPKSTIKSPNAASSEITSPADKGGLGIIKFLLGQRRYMP